MPQDLIIEKVRAALSARSLTLTGSLTRIVMLLPERRRVNVIVCDTDGHEDAATLMLDENGSVSVQLSDERRNVRFLTHKQR